jgi:hypothetical protein
MSSRFPDPAKEERDWLVRPRHYCPISFKKITQIGDETGCSGKEFH